MSEVIIKAENLSKRYRINTLEGYKTFRETLVNFAKVPLEKITRFNSKSVIEHQQSDTIWALDNISFELNQGEILGVIGRNGAGKTTLLKILSKITLPTEGRVKLRGRVGSLLEVGTGFHPELTGHENIYLSGSILGMDSREISRKFDEIVAFAELSEFIDTPVKRYSSGMYVRLAFSVAAHLEPDILLVDEVLAVGDAKFWTKSINRMRTLNEQGMTIILVSHNMWIVQTVCTKAMLLEKGQIVEKGAPMSVIASYREKIKDDKDEYNGDRQTTPVAQMAEQITTFQVHPEGEWASNNEALPYSGIRVIIGARVHTLRKVKFLIRITSPDGICYFTVYSDLIDVPKSGRLECEVVIPRLMLLPGEFLIWGAICSPKGEEEILVAENAPLFVKKINGLSKDFGLFWNQAYWKIR